MSGIPNNWEANKHAAPTLILKRLDFQSELVSSGEDIHGPLPDQKLHNPLEEWASEI